MLAARRFSSIFSYSPQQRFLSSSQSRWNAFVRDTNPRSASFSPLSARSGGASSPYRNPYATSYPNEPAVLNQVPVRRPYERILCVRRIVKYDLLLLLDQANSCIPHCFYPIPLAPQLLRCSIVPDIF
jgi:hypothetical protein